MDYTRIDGFFIGCCYILNLHQLDFKIVLIKFIWDYFVVWKDIKFYAKMFPRKKKKEDWVKQIQFMVWKASQEQFK